MSKTATTSKKNSTHPLHFGVLDTIHGRRGIHDRMSSLTVPLDAYRPRTALDDFAGFGVDDDTQGDAAFGFLGSLRPPRLRGRRFGVERHPLACMSRCGGFFDARTRSLGEEECVSEREGRSRSNENAKRTLRSLRSSSSTVLSSSSTSSCAASSSVLAKSASNTSSSSTK